MHPSTYVAGLLTLLIAIVIIWAGLFGGPEYQVGNISFRSAGDGVNLVSSTSPVTAGRYDTLQSPRGSAYSVPADRTLYLGSILGTPHASASLDTTITLGYANAAVSNSSAAPDTPVIVFSYTYRTADGALLPADIFVPIPEGKYPFTFVDRPIVLSVNGITR